MLLNSYLAIAAIAVAAPGCSDAAKPDSGPDVSGRWAMFSFEDPVAVDLRQAGGAIDGRGCCAESPDGRCCGRLTGQMVDGRASFGFVPGQFTQDVYSTDAFVSSDGKRMAGAFSRMTLPVAWVRIGSRDPHLPPPDPALESIIRMLGGRYALVLSNDPGGASDFSPQQTYELYVVESGFLFGHLGAFWSGEMAWSAAQQTLVVGPVPETAPGSPVAMSLRFDGTVLASVEAVMASGVRYQFQATPWQP